MSWQTNSAADSYLSSVMKTRLTPLVPGLVSVTFRKLGFTEIIRLVRQAGLRAIEWGGDVHVPHGDLARAREVSRQTRAAGLTVAAYGSYYRAAHSEALPAESRVDFARVLETAVTLCAPVIRVWAGVEGSARASADMRRRVADDLMRIAALAAQAGVHVATEFHGGTLTDTNESARALLLEEAAHPNLYSYWQTPVGMSDEDCLAGLSLIGPKLSHLHVFNWVWGASGEIEAHPLGEGEGPARWRQFFAAAAASISTKPQSTAADTVANPIAAMLEFVPGGSPESLLNEARTLTTLLGELS